MKGDFSIQNKKTLTYTACGFTGAVLSSLYCSKEKRTIDKIPLHKGKYNIPKHDSKIKMRQYADNGLIEDIGLSPFEVAKGKTEYEEAIKNLKALKIKALQKRFKKGFIGLLLGLLTGYLVDKKILSKSK